MADPGGARLSMSRGRRLTGLWAALLLLVAVLFAWYATHPPALPVSTTRVSASTTLETPLYVGVLASATHGGRTLHLNDVQVGGTGIKGSEATPLICVDGALSVTVDPHAFCEDLVPAIGAVLRPGDQLVVRFRAPSPGELHVPQVDVSYREGLRWGTQPAGPPMVIRVVSRG